MSGQLPIYLKDRLKTRIKRLKNLRTQLRIVGIYGKHSDRARALNYTQQHIEKCNANYCDFCARFIRWSRVNTYDI